MIHHDQIVLHTCAVCRCVVAPDQKVEHMQWHIDEEHDLGSVAFPVVSPGPTCSRCPKTPPARWLVFTGDHYVCDDHLADALAG